jgi:hypothetical protein
MSTLLKLAFGILVVLAGATTTFGQGSGSLPKTQVPEVTIKTVCAPGSFTGKNGETVNVTSGCVSVSQTSDGKVTVNPDPGAQFSTNNFGPGDIVNVPSTCSVTTSGQGYTVNMQTHAVATVSATGSAATVNMPGGQATVTAGSTTIFKT